MSATQAVTLPIDFTLAPAPKRPAATPVYGPTLPPSYEKDGYTPSADRQRWSFDGAAPKDEGFSPKKGLKVGTDLGDGWRLDGSLSPKRRGTVKVGISRTF